MASVRRWRAARSRSAMSTIANLNTQAIDIARYCSGTSPSCLQQLSRMRRETADYGLSPDHDSARRLAMSKECAALWDAIECFRRGEMPVLPSHAKYLE